MEEAAIKDYLSRLGCRKIKTSRQQVNSTCPFAARHSKGKDERPGFTVKINVLGKSPYWCPSCKSSDSMEWLVWEKFGVMDGIQAGPDEYINARVWGKKINEEVPEVFLNDALLKPFSGSVPKYALDRGLTIETCKAWGLGHDKYFKRLTFPVYDEKGRLVGLSGRATGEHSIKYANYSWDKKWGKLVPFIDHDREDDFVTMHKSKYLYGANMLTYGTDIVVVEGQIDVTMSWQNGFDSLGLFGSWASSEQAYKLVSLCPADKALIILLDNDKAGKEGLARIKEVLCPKLKVRIATCPEGKDPGTMFSHEELSAVVSAAVSC